jgi:hypothetical protein
MDLRSIVQTYITHIRPQVNEELEWWRGQPTLGEALRCAAYATNSKGKRYSHQRRLKKATLDAVYAVLLANEQRIAHCRDFDKLYTLLAEVLAPVQAMDELYVYDAAVRIGAKLGKLPGKVYLRAGTREGAEALGLNPNARALEVTQLPVELQQLEPYEIEDLLCIFRGGLLNVRAGTAI